MRKRTEELHMHFSRQNDYPHAYFIHFIQPFVSENRFIACTFLLLLTFICIIYHRRGRHTLYYPIKFHYISYPSEKKSKKGDREKVKKDSNFGANNPLMVFHLHSTPSKIISAPLMTFREIKNFCHPREKFKFRFK